MVLSHHRNASLGNGDADDRMHPEQVVLGSHTVSDGSEKACDANTFKLQPALARDVQMSRLHTGMPKYPHLIVP